MYEPLFGHPEAFVKTLTFAPKAKNCITMSEIRTLIDFTQLDSTGTAELIIEFNRGVSTSAR